jgi:hypothetical protein
MLNLQTITEQLGTQCKGRAWVIVTSQEDIDAAIGEANKAKGQDFSKIQGRFTPGCRWPAATPTKSSACVC